MFLCKLLGRSVVSDGLPFPSLNRFTCRLKHGEMREVYEGVLKTKNSYRHKRARVSAGDLNVCCSGMPFMEPWARLRCDD